MSNMIADHFNQGQLHYSEGKDTMVKIADMAPQHAANAAEKLMREAAFWATQGQVGTRQPITWMARTPLVQALWERSHAGRADAKAVEASMRLATAIRSARSLR